jgi:phosphatidylserine decarboxylase
MNKPFSIILQYLLPHHLLTRLFGKIANSSFWGLKRYLIPLYIKHYQVNMQEALYEDLSRYKTFNEFFTRQLKPSVRPICENLQAVISPADGVVCELGDITQGKLIQAKGLDYSLKNLFAGKQQLSALFEEGRFATIYLSPRDYHRVHMPVTGKLKEIIYVPGKLFSVNVLTSQHVPDLFTRNERAIFIFDTAIGPLAVIMVGAMIVAGIHTVCTGKLKRSSQIQHFDYSQENKVFQRGDELGFFELGSTVILLFAKDAVCFVEKMQQQTAVKLGEALAVLAINLPKC